MQYRCKIGFLFLILESYLNIKYFNILNVYLNIQGYSFFFFSVFLGPHLQHMDIPRLGVELEL